MGGQESSIGPEKPSHRAVCRASRSIGVRRRTCFILSVMWTGGLGKAALKRRWMKF